MLCPKVTSISKTEKHVSDIVCISLNNNFISRGHKLPPYRGYSLTNKQYHMYVQIQKCMYDF